MGEVSHDVGEDSDDVGEDSDDGGEDSHDVGEDSDDVGADADDAGEDSHDVGEDSGDVGEDSGDVGEDSDDVGEDADDAGEDSDDAGEDSDDVGEESDEVGEHSRDVEEDSHDVRGFSQRGRVRLLRWNFQVMRAVSKAMKVWLFFPLLVGCGAAVQAPTQRVAVSNQIVTQSEDTTEPELFKRAERELQGGQFADARRDFELLLEVGPSAKILPSVLLDLGTACEALGDRQAAETAYHALASKFPALPTARTALVRCLAIHAVLEQWPELAETGDALLARTDIDGLDRIAGLGARGLSNAERGDTTLAMKDVGAGVDLMESLGMDRTGRLPPSAALLELALGETKRIETERIQLMPVGSDFVMKVSNRCQGLLDAQAAYAQAMRTNDLEWGMMAGYRLAAMYETLHRELMSIPPDGFAKNETQRQLFYGIMHVRYRALLEKALIMLSTTLDAADLVGSAPTNTAVQAGILPEWLRRGREEKARMEADLAEEKATLAKFPFTEQDLENTLKTLQQKYDKHK